MREQTFREVEDAGTEQTVTEPTVREVSSVELHGGEAEFARNNPNLYGLLGAAASIVPFAEFAFPSYREEFRNDSLLKQAAILGLDAAVVLPAGWIGKGFKVVGGGALKVPLYGVKKGLEALNIAEKSLADTSPKIIDSLMRKMDEFVPRTSVTGLMRKYGLTEEEATSVAAGKKYVWKGWGRGGASMAEESQAINKLLTEKGAFKSSVLKDIETWRKPVEAQKFDFYKSEWRRYFGKYTQASEYDIDQLFAGKVRQLFGEEAAKKMTLGNIEEKDFMKVLQDSLLNEGKILRHVDSNWSAYLFPIRKIAGAWEKAYGTLSKLYEPMKAGVTDMRRVIYDDLTQFHLLQAEKGLGKMTKRGFSEAYSGAEWREAEKLVRKLDNLQSQGIEQEVINKVFDSVSPTVQKIVKSYQEWADYMYAKQVKMMIGRAFEKLNPTDIGRDAFDSLMSPYGQKMNSYITEIFGAGNNLAWEQKVKALGKVLENIKNKVTSNAHWVKDPTTEKYEGFLKDLSFRKANDKAGLPDYLRNYGARIYEPGYGRYARKVTQNIGRQMEPGFVKGRTVEVAEEAMEDLKRMIGSRLRSQARDEVINPLLPGWKDSIAALPPNLRNYFNHYLNRLLGKASPADDAVARFVNATFGTFWTGQRVRDLAYSINDLVYLGGIGFKPFSAMRNLLQPMLMVPSDLGGIKDYVWLVKGYHRGLSGEGIDYLRKIGVITEYSPDILFAPEITKFGKTFSLRGKEFTPPSLRRVRDIGMWMFKLSDRMNRYVTGGAAMSKWEWYTKKILQEEGTFKLNEEALSRFVKKINLSTRDAPVREKILSQLRSYTREGFEEAKKTYVKDVVADTQFLYGNADAPLLNQKWGAVGKNALVFQSWWMNYGAELQKWLVHSGSVDEAAQRVFTWMLSSAVLGNLVIPPIWGENTAKRTVFTGPFPLSLDIPAPWRPIRDGFNSIIAAGEASIGLSDLDTVKRRMISTLKSSMIYVPAGTQMVSLARGASKEGFPGFMKEIVRYRPAK